MPTAKPRDAAGHRIGEAARASGVSAANIRYYEREGLLAPGQRAGNDYRLYSAADVHRLRFIRLCRALDMSLDEVRALLALDWHDAHACAAADATLAAHIGHVRERLAELRALERELLALRAQCRGPEAAVPGQPCGLIEALHARADEACSGGRAAAVARGHQPARRRVARHV